MEIKEILHNSKEYWELVSLRDEILRKPISLKFSKEELHNENNQNHFAVFENKKIIAGLILVNIDHKLMKMRQVCVSVNHQNQGIGYKLVSFAEQWAKKKKHERMYCHARQNALNFYSKLDYKKVGDSFLEVGLEHYKLIKEL